MRHYINYSGTILISNNMIVEYSNNACYTTTYNKKRLNTNYNLWRVNEKNN